MINHILDECNEMDDIGMTHILPVQAARQTDSHLEFEHILLPLGLFQCLEHKAMRLWGVSRVFVRSVIMQPPNVLDPDTDLDLPRC